MQKLLYNPLLQTDSYKLSHFKQYPPNTQRVYSYLESRGGYFDQIVFFGLQYILESYLTGQVISFYDIEKADRFAAEHFGRSVFNKVGWVNLLRQHDGKLPLRIKAVPEGTVVSANNVLMTVENTDEEFPWLTNWAETMLLQVWYPITVATISRAIKTVIANALEKTGNPAGIPFKLHDFGYRGVSSQESAAIGGAAHLINFTGTDTLAGIRLLQQYYGAKAMPGFSIPASEHSTITAWGKEHEADAYENMLIQYPDGLVACVSDSYDIFNAVKNIWGGVLREKVMGRQGTLVIRPDSGEPAEVITKVFEILEERFGTTTNSKGYKVLSDCVRVIQGDGVNYHSIINIVNHITSRGWSMDNLAFGMGGALLQQLNRDTLKFAFKCSAIKIDGAWRDVYKDPVTDAGKKSKRGRLVLTEIGGTYTTLALDDRYVYEEDVLETVFENGAMKRFQTLDDIRKRAEVETQERLLGSSVR